MHRNKQGKGISTIIAAIFMVAIIIVGLNVMTWGLNLQNNFGQVITERNVAETEQGSEKMELRDVTIDNNKFNMTVVNTGSLPVKLVKMWVTNDTCTTATCTSTNWHLNYDLNNLINPGDSLTKLGQGLSLIAKNSSSYKINLVTERGSSANFQILSPKDKAIKMDLFAVPRSIPTGQDVTVIFGVTNNLTDGSIVQSVRPNVPLSWTATEAPTGLTAATATLVEGPTPAMEQSLTLGDAAFFKWVYKITGDKADKIKFNATIVNAKTGNYITETVEVVIDEFAGQSTELSAAGINVAATEILFTAFGGTNLLVNQGSFAKSTAAAPAQQSFTTGWRPKAVILFTTGQTTEGFADIYNFAIGFSSGSQINDQRSIGVRSDDNVDIHNSGRAFGTRTLKILSSSDPQTIAAEADMQTFDSTGFTIKWTTNDSTASIIHYIALGGSDLTNSFASSFTANTVTGNQAVTGVGFQPNFVMFMQARSTSDTGTATHINMGLGFAESSTERGAVAVYSRDGSDSNKFRYQRTDRVILQYSEPSGTIDAEADFVSMDAGGFTINWIDPPSSADFVYYLALKGGLYDVGKFDKTTVSAPAAQSVTGVGFQPKALILSSFNNIAATTRQLDNRQSFGASSGTYEGTIWAGDRDNVPNSITARSQTTTKVIRLGIEAAAGGSSGINAEADLQSFDSDGFTLNWTTNDAIVYAGGDLPLNIKNSGTDTIWVDASSRIILNKIGTDAIYGGIIKKWQNETSGATGTINGTLDSDALEPGKSLKFFFSEPRVIPGVQSTGTSVLTNTGNYDAYVRLNGYDNQGRFVLRVVIIGVLVV